MRASRFGVDISELILVRGCVGLCVRVQFGSVFSGVGVYAFFFKKNILVFGVEIFLAFTLHLSWSTRG